MPSVVSEETRLARLERHYTDVYRDLAYQLHDIETDRMGPVHGGRWHVHEHRFLAPWELKFHELSAQTDDDRDRARLDVVRREVHSLQFDICEDTTTPVLLGLGSRRGGKSRSIGFKSAINALEWPHVGGEVIGPTYDKLQIMWRYVLDAIPPHWIERSRADEHWIELVTGQRIKFISAHKPDSVIGEGVGWINFDELQSVKEVAWSLALPAASDGGSAFQLCGVGTPRMGEFRQRYERIRTLEGQGRARIIHFTFRNNVFIESGEGTIFDFAASLIDPRKRQQELEAEFVAEEGLVYYRFDRNVHDRGWDDLQQRRDRPWAKDITASWLSAELEPAVTPRYLIGVDYGIGRNYAIVYKVIKAHGMVGLWAIGEVYGDREYDIEDLIAELVDRRYYPAIVCDDASGPRSDGGRRAEDYFEGVHIKGKPVFEVRHSTTNPAVADRVDALNALMGNTLNQVRWYVDVDKCPRLVECLENQEMELGKPRRSKRGEVSYHDMPDAAGYPAIYLFPCDVAYEREERRAA